MTGAASGNFGYISSCLMGVAGRAMGAVCVVAEDAMCLRSLGLLIVSIDSSLTRFFCSDLGVLWYVPGKLARGLSIDAKSSNDSSLESLDEGVTGDGKRSFTLTRNEYSGCADGARLRSLSAGKKNEASVISLSCAANSSRVTLRSSECAFGLSTLPVLSEVSLAVGSS